MYAFICQLKDNIIPLCSGEPQWHCLLYYLYNKHAGNCISVSCQIEQNMSVLEILLLYSNNWDSKWLENINNISDTIISRSIYQVRNKNRTLCACVRYTCIYSYTLRNWLLILDKLFKIRLYLSSPDWFWTKHYAVFWLKNEKFRYNR